MEGSTSENKGLQKTIKENQARGFEEANIVHQGTKMWEK